jgi:hypothetical protein
MFRNYFELSSVWTLDGSLAEVGALVAEAIADPSVTERIWPGVFLCSQARRPGAGAGPGRPVQLCTRGRLPYTLTWEVVMTEACHLQRYVQVATGDFAGIAIWTLETTTAGVRVRLDWRLRVDKPVLRRLVFLLKPLLAWNHRWAMARGQKCLDRELQRRRTLGRAA